MELEVFLTPHTLTDQDVRNRTVVVLDVLRASSTIVTALSHEARCIVPVPDMAAAYRLTSNLDTDQYLIGGERNGVKIDGCHLGNSPLEYTREQVAGRTVVLKTTNGTGAILAGQAAGQLVIGSFLNADRVVEFVRQTAAPLTIVCAGWRGRFSYEDTLCAGFLIDRLWNGTVPRQISDATYAAHTLYRAVRTDIDAALAGCDAAQLLGSLGQQSDVAYCAQTDVLEALPRLQDKMLVL